MNLRLSLLDGHPTARAAYYAVDILCGVAIALRPSVAPIVALLESAANIAILLVGVMLAYLAMLDSAGGSGPIVNPFTPESVANLAISAAWAYAAWIRSTAAITAGRVARG